MRMTCVKCGLVNPQAESAEDSCPKCGAIYSKAKAMPASSPRVASDGRASGFSAPSTLGGSGSPGDYVARLRASSQYPAFRSVISVMCLLGYVVAAVVLIGGVFTWWKFGSTGVGVSSVTAACLITVFAKASKEASLMLADLSDATLRMARQQERET